MSKIFLIPLMYCRIQVIPPKKNNHVIIKVAKLVSVFEAEIDHPLGSLKVKAANSRNLEDNFPSYLHISLAMGNRLPWQQKDISISQLSDLV